MSNFVTQDRIAVSVDTMPGPWATISGQQAERENVKMKEVSGGPKVTIHTDLNYGDITVTRLFDADRDADLLKQLNSGEVFENTTVTEQYLDSGGNPVPGKMSVHTGCVVAGFTAPEGDANSADMGMLTVTFSRTGAA